MSAGTDAGSTASGKARNKTGVTRTKDVETVLHQNDEDHAGLKKSLSARDLMGFGIGIVIGTGIFVLTGLEARSVSYTHLTLPTNREV